MPPRPAGPGARGEEGGAVSPGAQKRRKALHCVAHGARVRIERWRQAGGSITPPSLMPSRPATQTHCLCVVLRCLTCTQIQKARPWLGPGFCVMRYAHLPPHLPQARTPSAAAMAAGQPACCAAVWGAKERREEGDLVESGVAFACICKGVYVGSQTEWVCSASSSIAHIGSPTPPHFLGEWCATTRRNDDDGVSCQLATTQRSAIGWLPVSHKFYRVGVE